MPEHIKKKLFENPSPEEWLFYVCTIGYFSPSGVLNLGPKSVSIRGRK
jgi:hypothetical protein